MTEPALDSFLRGRRDETLLVVPPAGNLGDILLRSGFWKRIEELGIPSTRFGEFDKVNIIDIIENANPLDLNYRNIKSIGQTVIAGLLWVRYRMIADFDAIYLHGGAHFNEIWGGGIGCFRTATKLFDCDIIIGPQSCLFEEIDPTNILGEVNNDVYLFCREEYSYDRMNSAVGDLGNVNVELSQDTAFYLDKEDLIKNGLENEYTLLAFRDDKESTGPHNPEIPEDERTVEEDISLSKEALDEFLTAIERASHVYTDRLHVAIPATLMGKPTTFYGNSYYKNTAVFEYSLSSYDNIDFVD